MKKLLVISLMMITCQHALPQDVIIKNGGNEIKAKVKEITEQSIKYKRYDHLEGPLRNISKREVFMIIYENGKTEKFASPKTPENGEQDNASSGNTKDQTRAKASKFDKDSGTFIDQRDGKKYKWVRIGDQVWMAENLNHGTMLSEFKKDPKDNDEVEKWCYENKKSNCREYGALYSWNEAMQHQPSDKGKNGTVQGVCPDGWHIPTDYEWQQLEMALGLTPEEANAIYIRGKEDEIGLKLQPGGSSGFNALMAGNAVGGLFSKYKSLKEIAAFWTATTAERFGDKLAWYRRIVKDEGAITRMGQHKILGLSVRCIKNKKDTND